MINALDGNHLWAERFDGDIDDLFDLQDDITRRIVVSIAPQIELAEVERGRGLHPATLSSYELALKAKSLAYDAFRYGDAERLQSAIDTARVALRQDSRNTHALSILCLAFLEQYTYQWGEDYENALVLGLQAAEQLIRTDSSHAGGYVLRGDMHIYHRDFELAIADFEHGLSLNPNSSNHLIHAAWGKSLAGLTADAKAHAELALRLSPREPDIFLGYAYLGLLQASFAEADFEQAMKWGRLAIQMHASAPIRRVLMIACCALTGNRDEARQHADALARFSPDFAGSLLRGELLLYRYDEHNALVHKGLRKSGLFDSG